MACLDAVLAEEGWLRKDGRLSDGMARRLTLWASGDDEHTMIEWEAGESYQFSAKAAAARLSERLRVRAAVTTEEPSFAYAEWASGRPSLLWDDQGTYEGMMNEGRVPEPSDQAWLARFEAEQNVPVDVPVPSAGERLWDIAKARIELADRRRDVSSVLYEHRSWVPWEGGVAAEAAAWFDDLYMHACMNGFIEIPRFGRLRNALTPSGRRVFQFHPSAALAEAVRHPGYPIATEEPFVDDAVQALLRGDEDIPLGRYMLLYRLPPPQAQVGMLVRLST